MGKSFFTRKSNLDHKIVFRSYGTGKICFTQHFPHSQSPTLSTLQNIQPTKAVNGTITQIICLE